MVVTATLAPLVKPAETSKLLLGVVSMTPTPTCNIYTVRRYAAMLKTRQVVRHSKSIVQLTLKKFVI